MKQSTEGFTLIEILVAMSILFMIVTTGLMAYQSALAQTERANKIINMVSSLEFIIEQVKNELRDEPYKTSGSGKILGVLYEWTARPGPVTSPAPTYLSTGEVKINPPTILLTLVTLQLFYQGSERTFTYEELTWLPNNNQVSL